MSTSSTDLPKAPPVPVLGGVIAYLMVDGASAAAEFYKRAFDAKEVFRYPVDDQGRTMHIHLHINGSSVMLGDFYPEHGNAKQKPQGFLLNLNIRSGIDDWLKRAVDAGAEVTLPLQEMFWGDRYAQLRDPFGVNWSMNEPLAR